MGTREQQWAEKAQALFSMRAADLFSPRWQPLPHQVPPPGDWYGWVTIAGRGAGKTDSCAHHIVEHVRGPACLPGKTPHWIGIIAPTLGDAATACFSGPSGIRAHDSTATMVSRPGGLTVLWPNGSEAKLFGANSPDDVERLRAGGNRCIREGSLIQTEQGLVPIQDVRVGDRVWTRNGLRRVLRTWDNGLRRVQRFDHAAGSTWLTPDHEVWTTDRGWQQAQFVTTDDTVLSWDNTAKQLNTTASGGTPTHEIRTTGTVSVDYCTGGCGLRRSGPSRVGCTCTTRTMTSGTTALTTSCYCPQVNTGRSTKGNAVPIGIGGEERRQTLSECGRTSPVTDAGAYFAAVPTRGIAFGIAPVHVEILRHAREKSGCAACAATGSPRQSGARPAPVRASALRTTAQGSSEAKVYDLTVEHDHEFFADGLLVSNCVTWCEELAAWRYLDQAWDQMRFGLRTGPRPHWIGSTTPKPRPLIRRLYIEKVRNTVLTKASYLDNPHLPQEIKDLLEESYGGTQLGRQELYGELIDQDENALWTHTAIDGARVSPDDLPKLSRITVGVDPSGGAGEQGIVVAGKALLPGPNGKQVTHGFVLADRTCHLPPDGWGRRAVMAAVDLQADDIVVERNYGDALAVATIRSAAESMGVPVPIRTTWATRGKRVRAEPVSALTSQGRWHHAGAFPELEDQLCTWTPELDWSPDRLDAMVWTAWHNRVVQLSGGSGTVGAGASRQVIG